MSKDLIKILIVDDNLIDHQIYKRLLSANNSVDYEYSLQESGEEGLRAVQEFHPNCILLDYMIPDMDGLSFLKKLADNAERVTIPVVMLTGQGNEKVAVEAMKYGVSDYLVKDEISSNVLNQSVYSALEKDQLRKQLRENEIKLKLSEERYNLAIQSTNIAIWDWDIEKITRNIPAIQSTDIELLKNAK